MEFLLLQEQLESVAKAAPAGRPGGGARTLSIIFFSAHFEMLFWSFEVAESQVIAGVTGNALERLSLNLILLFTLILLMLDRQVAHVFPMLAVAAADFLQWWFAQSRGDSSGVQSDDSKMGFPCLENGISSKKWDFLWKLVSNQTEFPIVDWRILEIMNFQWWLTMANYGISTINYGISNCWEMLSSERGQRGQKIFPRDHDGNSKHVQSVTSGFWVDFYGFLVSFF